MKIAYIILAHKLPEQLVRLVKKLNTGTASFLIHVDRKTDKETYQKMVKLLSIYKNVHFLKRHSSNWGTFGQVQAALEGIRGALALRLEFEYMILLTGQDYPIKANGQIEKFLENSNGRSYLEYFMLPSEIWANENGGMDRIDYLHMYFWGRPHQILPRSNLAKQKLIKFASLFGGRSNWCLTRECIEYLDEYLRRDDSFARFCKYAGLPDEIFFQTILLNSHLKPQLVNDNLRYVVWRNLPNPAVLRVQDYDRFINSNKLFARKFDIAVDVSILDMIDSATS